MAKIDVQRLLGKMILDQKFKAALRENPEESLSQLGLNLSAEEKRFVELTYEIEDANRRRRLEPLANCEKEVDDLVARIVSQRSRITLDTICQIHEAIFTPGTLGEVGKFRQKSAYLRDVDVLNCQVKIEPISARLPASEEVPALLVDFCQWLNTELGKKQEDPILLAAAAKHKFVCIHPFVDGNGRVGRAIVNLILEWFDLPKSLMLEEKREDYYKALKLADEGNLKMLRDFIEAGMLHNEEVRANVSKSS